MLKAGPQATGLGGLWGELERLCGEEPPGIKASPGFRNAFRGSETEA